METTEQNTSSSKNNAWREKLKNLGKENFIISEMTRLGFLSVAPENLQVLRDGFDRLEVIQKELAAIRKELQGTEDITPLLKEIRQNRIERVRAQRTIKKAERAEAAAAARKKFLAEKQTKPFYLGDGVSKGLKFAASDASKLSDNGLPVLHTLDDVAAASGLDASKWQWLAYHRKAATLDHYTRFQIPKKKGGLRSIASPKATLRKAQAWVLAEILSKRADASSSDASFAFQKGKSIVQNAAKHLNKAVVVRMDLKDFFPSIKFRRVKGLFNKLGYNEGLATVFALVCTDSVRIEAALDGKRYFVALGERFVPQGACTSPALTNMLARDLDMRLMRFSEKYLWTYTRYADDLTFSTDHPTPDLRQLLGVAAKIIRDEGFEINAAKTLVMRSHQRQSVTGVVVNNAEAKVSRRDAKRFRAVLHHIETEGEETVSKKLGKSATAYAKGYIAYLSMINPQQAEKFKAKHKWLA
ncbi:MAG: RNA-directed DNA polymerase [Rhizobacter sp.]|nr:RNA-directed DNA polymerase [Chlorobiales bacterium]